MAELCIDNNPAFKLFIRDLTSCERFRDAWQINFGNQSNKKTLHQFHIQVKVSKLTGFNNEIMIVEDSTGKAKVTRSSKVPGEFSWLKIGSACSIIGTLIEAGKLPQVDVVKMARIDSSIQQEMWPLEVMELRNFLANKLAPSIDFD